MTTTNSKEEFCTCEFEVDDSSSSEDEFLSQNVDYSYQSHLDAFAFFITTDLDF